MTPIGSAEPAVAVTVDVYDTIIRYDGADHFFEELLRDQLSDDGCVAFRQRYDQEMVATFHRLTSLDFGREPFVTLKDLYRRIFETLAPEFGVVLDAAKATQALVRVVGEMPAYPETPEFLRLLRERHPHCVVSDIDDDILDIALAHNGLAFEHIVTSEAARCYKCSVGGDMFQRAAAKMGVPVESVVHLGDWMPDVVGARAAGAKVIRVCRDGSAFGRDTPAPDARASDLLEALALVEHV